VWGSKKFTEYDQGASSCAASSMKVIAFSAHHVVWWCSASTLPNT
jgi:hypothetical protein